MSWQEAMFEELDTMTPLQQFVTCGAWITQMQQNLVPELSVRRRVKLVEAADEYGQDYLRMAEEIGSRRGTVERLVHEGKAHLRSVAGQ